MNSSEAKREKMLSLVEAWRTSGQTQKQFCTQVGIKIATLSYWITQSRLISQSNPVEGKFIAIAPKKITKDQSIEVLYPNGVSVKIQVDIQALDRQADLALLSHLIHLY